MIKCFLTPQNYVTDILAGAVSHAMTNILYKINDKINYEIPANKAGRSSEATIYQ